MALLLDSVMRNPSLPDAHNPIKRFELMEQQRRERSRQQNSNYL
jgi:hypothetical protein